MKQDLVKSVNQVLSTFSLV